MSSIEKPPLPHISIIGKRPEIFCLDFISQKKCDKFNKIQEKKNKDAWDEYHRKYKEWERITNKHSD